MEISRLVPEFARADAKKKPDLVALADDSKRGVGGAEARRHGVHFDDHSAGADRRAAELRAEERAARALELREAREAAMRDESFDVDV